MKLTLISDTHNHQFRLKELPPADVLIHAGDLTSMGTVAELANVAKWMKELLKNKQFKKIVLTPGNHDFLFQDQEGFARDIFEHKDIHVLINEHVMIDGMKFYGSPQNIEFHDWAFNVRKDRIHIYWDEIPTDTDILITHQPPYGIGDKVQYTDEVNIPRNKNQEHLGCPALLEKVRAIQPRLHVFGHIHSGSGFYRIGKTIAVNAAQLDERYFNAYQPYEVEI